MPEHPPHLTDDSDPLTELLPESPRHGFQGDRGVRAGSSSVPASLTVAISRESGSRGASIAGRVGTKLGWQVYSQDLLEYIAQDAPSRQEIVENLAPAASGWVTDHLDRLLRAERLNWHPSLVAMARTVLALGASGEAVLIGRGAGCILPRASTLHARIIAPLEDRIAYMSQWLRLPVDEAAEQVRQRDVRRAEFLATHFHRQPGDVYQYDLLLNSSLLGEDLCAELIAQAARAKFAAWATARGQ
ncbi:MAG: cytidylate kinase-like family protein [Gemmataceae bacterium]|nr:cytidylate kinase-like family protein [Gemmataceae bacterium]